MPLPANIEWIGKDDPGFSTNVACIAYDQLTERCFVTFHNGGVYEYTDVGPHEWEDFLNAESKGKHLNQHIKPYHPYSKI
jgi:hypothetical protein